MANCLPLQTRWNFFKVQIREFSQTYCKKKAIEKKDSNLLLETELNELENLLMHNDQVINSYTDVKEKLEKIYKQESKGAGIKVHPRELFDVWVH